MEEEEMDLSQLLPLGSSESSETSSEMSLGEIQSNVVQAMKLTQVDKFGQCSEQNCIVASESSSLSEDVISNLGSNHSLSVQCVDTPMPTSCQAATCVELLNDQLDEELVVNAIIQGTSNIRSESLIASHPEIADSLIYRSLFLDWPQSQSQLVSLGSSESSETSSEMSLGEIPSNVVQAMKLKQVDESGQCSEQNCIVASESSSLSENVISNLGCNHSLSVQCVDTPMPTSCQSATCVELFNDQLDEELVVIIQGTSNIRSESLIASHPEIADSLIYRSLLLDWPQSQTGHETADKVQETLIILDPRSFLTAQHSQSVDALTTACRASLPSQTPERRSIQKTLKKLFRQPTPGNSHQVVSIATNTSGADLDQASHQEPRRPLHVRFFRGLKKSFRKTFCCLGDRRMVRE